LSQTLEVKVPDIGDYKDIPVIEVQVWLKPFDLGVSQRILIELAIVSGTIVAVLANLESSEVDWSGGFASTVGSISILAVLASGFSEYREAMGGAKKPLT